MTISIGASLRTTPDSVRGEALSGVGGLLPGRRRRDLSQECREWTAGSRQPVDRRRWIVVGDAPVDEPRGLEILEGEGQGARRLRIVELQARERAPEPVEPGAAREVAVAGRTGLLIDGEWVTRDGQQTWQRGTLLRLIVEDGDLVIQLEADPRDGWDPERLVQVAASLR